MAEVNQKLDLITVRAKNLELPKGNIALKVSAKEIDASLMARIMEPVWKYLNEYKKLAIDPSIEKYDKQLEGMTDKKAADALAKQVNAELSKLVKNLEKEAQNRIKASWEKIKKENKEYTKWKLKIAANVTFGVIKIGKGIAALISTAGAKVDEYFKIAKSIKSIADELKKALASEAKVRGQLMTALEKMSSATKDGKVGKSHISNVENAVKEYDAKLTAARQKASSLSGPLQKLLELKDKGVPVTSKQEKQINDMIVKIIDFNETEQMGRQFSAAALSKTKEVDGKMDLKTLKGYADKLKTAVNGAIKVFGAVADIL